MVARRSLAGLVLLSVLGAGTACGGAQNQTAVPGPRATTPPKPVSTAAIPPTKYAEAFASVAAAADAMPATAKRLAAGLAAAGEVRGQADSPASELRSMLTHRLTLHVHLFGLAASSVLDTGPDNARTKAALAAVDRNAKSLAKLIGTAAAPTEKPAVEAAPVEDGEAESDTARRSTNFLVAWRTHVEDLAAFALAAREGIEPDKDDIRRDLDTWRDAAAESLKDLAAGQVRSSTLRGQLGRYTQAITRAIDALAAKDVTAPQQLRKAAKAMFDFSESLGHGLAQARDLDGDARDRAAEIRAGLTWLLGEHVAMTGATVLASYANRKAGGTASPAAQIAKLGLDENSKALSERLDPPADPRAQADFLQLWRTTVNDFLDYAEAVRTGSERRGDAEVTALNRQRSTVARFLAGIADDKVAAPVLAAALKTHIANLTGAVQALAADVLPDRS